MEKSRNFSNLFFLIFISILSFLFIFEYANVYAGQTSEVQINVSGRVKVPETATPTSPAVPYPGHGTGYEGTAPTTTVVIVPAKIIFEGRAYPNAFLTLFKNEQVAATFFADSAGLFRRELTGVAPGTYNFGVFAEDGEGRRSVTTNFTAGVIAESVTTVSGIFISPTVSLAPGRAERGKEISVSGSSYPGSQVKVFIDANDVSKETITSGNGNWNLKIDTSYLKEGRHSTRAMTVYKDGGQSPFSETLDFTVVEKPSAAACNGADLNGDGKVDIVDFSILLYFWEQRNPENKCVDINGDGVVNIIDFSIMMYWWNG